VTLKDKIREGLVGVLPLDYGDPLVLKLILEIVIDVVNITLRSLT